MTPLLTLAQTTTYEMTPPASRLPPFVWSAFATINKVHGLWRWYRRAEVYSNPNNFAQLLAGHALNMVLGDTLMLRIAAQCLLISTRMLECIQQQAIVFEAGRNWIAAIKGHYPTYHKVSWEKNLPILSPGTEQSIGLMFRSAMTRIERIARCTMTLVVETFTLSMRIMDAVDAFCLSPHTRNEGINEGFVNAIKWLDALTENKEELLYGLEENKPIIEKIIKGSPLTYEALRSGVERTLEKTGTMQKGARQVADFGNGVLVDMAKRIASGSMVVTGLADYRPVVLAPRMA